ncbi:MAG TPA: formate dehydrogenase subunit alpha [bacterium]|nr:formate dehydrogenase subunit alpha [bacterium]
MPRLTINGQSCEVPEGTTLLAAASRLGITIPTLCDDPRLEPSGACRLCVVEIASAARPVTACNTVAADGMTVTTHSPDLERDRRTLLKLLAEHYPAGPLEAFPQKPFHRLLAQYGVQASGPPHAPRGDDSHPYLHADMSQCITCFRCVRICEEVQGQFVWKAWERGDATTIVPDSGTNLLESSCVACGACVDTCPTGALEDQGILKKGVPERWTRTTCPYCGVGCEMELGTIGPEVVTARPVLDAPVNKGHLCVKGRYAHEFVHAEDRITSPMIRDNGDWRPATWDEALSFAAARLQRIRKAHGPDAIGVLGSARATNEENYVAQKFARAVLGTNNVDCCARVCHTPSAAALKWMLGTGASTNSFDDIELSKTLLLVGTNATENHPVVGARIKEHVLKTGANLIVIDPRETELARYARIHLAPRPGTNIPLLHAMAHVLLAEGLADTGFLKARVTELEEFRNFIAEWTPERSAGICGVDASKIREAARHYATDRPSMSFHGLGLTEHVQGTEGVMALINLALLTGNLGRPGAGINPLRGQNNVQGAAHMGCDPGILTGAVSLKDNRERFENVWGAKIPETRGLNLLDMMDAADAGRFKALWVIGYDVLLSNANLTQTRKSFAAMDLVVIQDLFLNETAREFGTVFLPVVSSYEKDGTFMNAERRIQKVRKAIEPVGDSKTDLEVLYLAAKALGAEEILPQRSSEEVWNEIRRVWPAGAGISYGRIEDHGIQWPCPTEDDAGTAILHEGVFASGTTAALRRIDYRPTEETTTDDFPFLLSTGRTLYQFNAGTMTLRTPNALLRPRDLLEIAPADAERLRIREGETVSVVSRHGRIKLPARITPSVKPGELFATFHTPEAEVNLVTSPHRDRFVKACEYKVTAVRLETAAGKTR